MSDTNKTISSLNSEAAMLREKAIANAKERNAAERDIIKLRAALEAAADQLNKVYEDAFKQSIGYGLVTTDGRKFSCFELNQCGPAASAAREVLKETSND